jgi:hypothetical protein
MYLKITDMIEYCCFYEIMVIESNKKYKHLNFNGILLFR